MSIDFLERKSEYWKPDDPVWMSTRKQQWRFIERRLRNGDPENKIHRSTWKTLKRYFFFGDVSIPHYANRNTLPDLKQIILHLWFYPVMPKLEDIKFDDAYKMGNLDQHRSSFMTSLYRFLASSIKSKEDGPEFGVLSGRDELIAKFLNPRLDFRERIEWGKGTTISGCIEPDHLVNLVVGSTVSETSDYTKGYMKKAVYKPGKIGIYLWNHLDYAMEHYPSGIYSEYLVEHPHKISLENFTTKIDRIDKNFLIGLRYLLTFHDRLPNDTIENRPVAKELSERLITRYEKREFSDNMLKFWDRAKALTGKEPWLYM